MSGFKDSLNKLRFKRALLSSKKPLVGKKIFVCSNCNKEVESSVCFSLGNDAHWSKCPFCKNIKLL